VIANCVSDYFKRRLPKLGARFRAGAASNQTGVTVVHLDTSFTVPVAFYDDEVTDEVIDRKCRDAATDLALCMFTAIEPAIDPFTLIASSPKLAAFVARCVREGQDPMFPIGATTVDDGH
jgi:hypothetical protein